MPTADNPLYYINPDALRITPGYQGDPKVLYVDNRNATIQVYSTDVPNFSTKPDGGYLTYKIKSNSITVGSSNWDKIVNEDKPLHIYAVITIPATTAEVPAASASGSNQPDCRLIFCMTPPTEYTLEGIPVIVPDDDTGEDVEISRTHYIHLGTYTAQAVLGNDPTGNDDTFQYTLAWDTGYLGTDRYIEEFDIRPMFTNEQNENTGRNYTRQRQPLHAAVVYNGMAASLNQYPLEEGGVLVLDPDTINCSQFLLHMFRANSTIVLPLSRENVGLEYLFIGLQPQDIDGHYEGYNDEEYLITIATSSTADPTAWDPIQYISGGEVITARTFTPPFPCILRFIATPNGWIVMKYQDDYWR
jgi:hypothetical protein